MLIKRRESVTRKSQKVNVLAAGAIAVSLAFAAVPATASAASDVVSVKIDKTDLDTEVGMKRTYYKLRRTADNACQANNGRVSLPQKIAQDRCVDNLMRNFIRQIENEQLLAYHEDVFVKLG